MRTRESWVKQGLRCGFLDSKIHVAELYDRHNQLVLYNGQTFEWLQQAIHVPKLRILTLILSA
jgi:hypothetical protein